MGLTTRQAATAGLFGLVFGSTISLPLALHLLRPGARRPVLRWLAPNPGVSLEPAPDLNLSTPEAALLAALFEPYARLVLEAEFRSGYSGARTFLARPVRPDGRADAYTIAKLGQRRAIEMEYANYETYVKDTLPPVTARIQAPPAALRAAHRRSAEIEPGLAALRYTFIGEPGQSPQSLRQALLANPDPALLEKLFATFGPSWWMQRRPYTFRLAAEYDRVLPTHYVLEPVAERHTRASLLDGRRPPSQVHLEPGAIVRLEYVRVDEVRPDGRSLALVGQPTPGHPPLRLRWLSLASPLATPARVVATRAVLLRDFAAGFDQLGLPDPLAHLSAALDETVSGTQSTIHGDLNPENVLVGPGGLVWLIDFAQTREGHTLYDFAHLEASLLGQVISPAVKADADFLRHLVGPTHPLLAALHAIAGRCLFNPAVPREYHLALYLACVGALKFTNLDHTAKHRLFLAAAYYTRQLWPSA